MDASNSSTTNVPPVCIALITSGNILINRIVPYDSKISAATAVVFLFFIFLNTEYNFASGSSSLTTYPTAFELIPNNFAASSVVFST